MMYKNLFWLKMSGLVLVLITILSCNKESTFINLPVFGPTQAFYALSDNNTLTAFNAKDVRSVGSKTILNGFAQGETLLSIDFRPSTGELYGVSSLSKIYTIDIGTGIAKAVSTNAFTPNLNGTTVSLDFNPTTDRIRIVTSTGQNLRLNPETGLVVASDPAISSTSISGIAYSNSIAGATSTILYDLDPLARKLYKQDPPDNGTLVAVGNLDLSLGENVSFDISPDGSKALAIGKLGDSTKLFTINLTTGKAAVAGKFIPGTNIRGIAIPTTPVAYAVDDANNLLIFNPTSKTAATTIKALTGLPSGETIVGIDMRPLNAQLYALGTSNRLYTINLGTGVCTQVGSGTFNIPLVGTSFGFDFNPLTDLIRVVSNTRQNLNINPLTGAVTADVGLTSTTATISAAAYSNNFRGTSTTTLFVIDHTTDKLYSLNTATGALSELGELKIGDQKIDVGATNGFDIVSSSGNIAYGIFSVGGKNNVYQIDLSSGQLSFQFELTKAVTGFTLGLRL